eukprot:Nk52_evm1s2619 gene=Nk52_evmTU1s2619
MQQRIVNPPSASPIHLISLGFLLLLLLATPPPSQAAPSPGVVALFRDFAANLFGTPPGYCSSIATGGSGTETSSPLCQIVAYVPFKEGSEICNEEALTKFLNNDKVIKSRKREEKTPEKFEFGKAVGNGEFELIKGNIENFNKCNVLVRTDCAAEGAEDPMSLSSEDLGDVRLFQFDSTGKILCSSWEDKKVCNCKGKLKD